MRKQSSSAGDYRRGYLRYASGLAAALSLTYIAYFSVAYDWLSGTRLALLLLATAIAQLLIQLVVFLHVSSESRPRWTMWSIVYAFLTMLIIVIASLWIMMNMNYNMHMSPEQMQDFMLEQNKKGF